MEKLNKRLSIIFQKLNDYVLSADNFLKMILIKNKINSNLPVVIMGETGCGKTSLISYLALKLLRVKLLLFNVHAGISQKAFVEQIKPYFSIADLYPAENVWIFLDEFNTSDCMYVITEMITKSTLLGQGLPSNIKLLTACNPYKVRNTKKVNVGLIKEREQTRLVHAVFPLPDSLLEHIWDYGSLNENDEKDYIKAMIESLKLSDINLVSDLISISQCFIKNLEDVSSVSLRDIDRFRTFYLWFKVNINKRNSLMKEKHLIENSLETKCIVLCLFICYYVRLSSKDDRNEYISRIANKLDINKNDLMKIFEVEQNEYLNRMDLSKGIAKNSALRENIFVTFVCVLNKVPVYICGKPGCSKTLCIQLLTSSLRGKESLDPWFKTLPALFAVTYQGSEASSSEGIEAVFEKAKKIGEKMNKKENLNLNKPVVKEVHEDDLMCSNETSLEGLASTKPSTPLKRKGSPIRSIQNKKVHFFLNKLIVLYIF